MTSYELDGGILILRSGAHFSTEDLRRALDAAFEDPRFRRGMVLMFDNRGSRESAPTEEIALRIDILRSRLSRLSPYCAVVVDSSVHYGLARMGEAFAEKHGVRIRVFRDDIDAARAWLDECRGLTTPASRARREG